MAPADHAREAAAEWGKAIRLGRAALAPVAKNAGAAVTSRMNPLSSAKPNGRASGKGSKGSKGSLGKRLNPTKTEKGGRAGDAADALLSKLGMPGKLASKASLGSRAVERLTPNLGNLGNGNGSSGEKVQVPIQESIEIAVPVRVAWSLATRAEDYPEFLDRVSGGVRKDKNKAVFDAKVHGVEREIEVEILEERPERRLAWKATGGHDHTGVASFHELAPSLTHIELSIVHDSEGLVQKLARTTHLTQHAVRSDLHRFKAYAELWQDEEEIDEPEDEAAVAEAPEEEPTDESEDEEPVADAQEEEEPEEDEAEDDEELVDEEDEELGDEEDEELADEEDEELVDEEEEELVDEEDGDEYEDDDEEPEHAYSDVIEDYESEDAYADVVE
jgi:uncharacterized membrane protein